MPCQIQKTFHPQLFARTASDSSAIYKQQRRKPGKIMNEAFMRGYYEAYNSEDPDRLASLRLELRDLGVTVRWS